MRRLVYVNLFVSQVRGSIPLLWEQIVDLSYKPRLNIINHEQTVRTCLEILFLSKCFKLIFYFIISYLIDYRTINVISFLELRIWMLLHSVFLFICIFSQKLWSGILMIYCKDMESVLQLTWQIRSVFLYQSFQALLGIPLRGVLYLFYC